MEILAEVRKHPNARVFAFGIGSSVNRYLLDGMARYGRGEVEYVGLHEDGSAAARRFHERVRNPLLTDISIDWNGLPVSDVFPGVPADLFSAKPLVVTGRYAGAARGVVRLKGKAAGRPYFREIAVDLPAAAPQHDVLATLWARTKVNDLMAQDLAGIQRGNPQPELEAAITKLGLDFRLMTQFTSFVAVEESTISEGGTPRVIEVPVEMPEGVSYQGVFGNEAARHGGIAGMPMPVAPRFVPFVGGVRRAQEAGPEEVRRKPDGAGRDPRAKLSPALHGVAAGRTVEVRIVLHDTSAAALARLKALGVILLTPPNPAGIVVAKAAGDRLLAIAALAEVRYVSPSRA
jgi:Ca-activated chloride channel family protein